MEPELTIAGRKLAVGEPTYLIAEVGVNHDGSVEKALRLVEAAAKAGADAVKFQLFTPAEIVVAAAPTAVYQRETTGATDQRAMLERLTLTDYEFRRLKVACAASGVDFLVSAFSPYDVERAVGLGIPALKLGSGELTDPFVLEAARQTGLPLLVSTGMADMETVAWAVERLGKAKFLLFHCVSAYPAEEEELSLRAMVRLRERFGVPVGFSDHSIGNRAAMLSVTLGAVTIEKHFTLDKAAAGPDHRASLDPAGFRELVRSVRQTETILGDGEKRLTTSEEDTQRVARKSLRAARDLPAGHLLTREDLVAKRPADGLDPRRVDEVIGQVLERSIKADEPLPRDFLGK